MTAPVAVASIGWIVTSRPAPAPRHVTRTAELMSATAALVATTADGARLAYAVLGANGTTSIALRRLDQFESQPVPGTENGAFPVFSPDGGWPVEP